MEEKRFRITVLDILLILFIVLMILTILLNAGVIVLEAPASNEITYVIKAETSPAVKGTVIHEESEKRVGTVSEVSRSKEKVELINQEGTLSQYDKVDRYNYYITVSGSGNITETGYYLSDGTAIAPGTELAVTVGNVKITGTVVSVQ